MSIIFGQKGPQKTMVEKTYHLVLYLGPFGAYLMPLVTHIGFKRGSKMIVEMWRSTQLSSIWSKNISFCQKSTKKSTFLYALNEEEEFFYK